MSKIMNILRKCLKAIGALMLVIVVAGLATRIAAPTFDPPGDLVDMGGFRLHIDAQGQQNQHPTLVIEGGGGSPSELYHWLNEGLKDSIRVVRYDRAGLGFSDTSDTPRDPETIAKELHTLLDKAGESPPYIMAGHSLGGPYIRVFTELYPDEVVGMVLMDATHHDRATLITSIPSQGSLKFKTMIQLYKIQGVLGDLGVMLLIDHLFGPIMGRKMEGLPDSINDEVATFLNNGKHVRTMGKEMARYHGILQRASLKKDFGNLPLRVFAAAEKRDIPEKTYQKYLKKGIDLRKNKHISWELQKDLINLSSDSKFIEVNGNHNSMYTIKENAEVICKEILSMVKKER